MIDDDVHDQTPEQKAAEHKINVETFKQTMKKAALLKWYPQKFSFKQKPDEIQKALDEVDREFNNEMR
jgi:hypothetical protein